MNGYGATQLDVISHVLVFRQTCTTQFHGNLTGDIVFEFYQSNSRGFVLYMFAEKQEHGKCDLTKWCFAEKQDPTMLR